jgi:hypothetical protein
MNHGKEERIRTCLTRSWWIFDTQSVRAHTSNEGKNV